MQGFPDAWVVGLVVFALVLALVWQAVFPGLRDSSPEVEPPQARHPPPDLPG